MKTVFLLIVFYTGPTADLGTLWGQSFETKVICEEAGEEQEKYFREKDGTLASHLCIEVPDRS